MATEWELKQQEAAQKLQQRKLVGSVVGSVVELGAEHVLSTAIRSGGAQAAAAQSVGSANVIAGVINVVGNLGIAAWQFLSGKKAAKQREKLQKHQQAALDNISDIINVIKETGEVVVEEHGINPTTPEFEKVLYDNLFQTVGYRGNCNARIWMPGSKPGPNRPVWFVVEENGRKIIPTNLKDPPPNFQEHWYAECKNLKDSWIITYSNLLRRQGRLAELADFQEAHEAGSKYLRIVFGIVIAIAMFFVIRNMMRIK